MRERNGPLATALVGLVTLALVACGRDGATAPPAKVAAALQVVTVAAAPVAVVDTDRTVETTGSLLAWEEATVNTSVSGTVARLTVDLGDRVRAGQVMAELDPREFTLGMRQAEAALRATRDALLRAHAQVDATRAGLQQVRDGRKSLEANVKRWAVALEEARLNLERSTKLFEGQLIAQRDVDAARTQYESTVAQSEVAQMDMRQYPDRVRVAEAQVRSDASAVQVAEADVARRQAEVGLAEKRLGDATLRAPIAGAIARRHVNPGEYVKENAAVFSIVRSDPLKYSGVVSEHAALDVRVGQVVQLQVDPVAGRSFAGRVTRVSPAIDVSTRTALLEAEVPNQQGLLKPGLFARGVIVAGRDAAVLFVPDAAVSSFAGLTKVFVLAAGAAHERNVKLGRKRAGMVEILDGVRAGEQVATSGLGQLADGAPVSIQPGARAAP